jgi:hypothetical protein
VVVQSMLFPILRTSTLHPLAKRLATPHSKRPATPLAMDSGGRPVNAVLNSENFDPASFGQVPGDPTLQAPGNPEAQALTAR